MRVRSKLLLIRFSNWSSLKANSYANSELSAFVAYLSSLALSLHSIAIFLNNLLTIIFSCFVNWLSTCPFSVSSTANGRYFSTLIKNLTTLFRFELYKHLHWWFWVMIVNCISSIKIIRYQMNRFGRHFLWVAASDRLDLSFLDLVKVFLLLFLRI